MSRPGRTDGACHTASYGSLPIVAGDGVWFSVRYEPGAVIRDELERVIVGEGDHVTLPQVRRDEAIGTFDDPYVAQGLEFQGCYPDYP